MNMYVKQLLKRVSGFIVLLKLSQSEESGSHYKNETVVIIAM